MSATTLTPNIFTSPEQPWNLPYRGRVAMYCLIIGESAIFTIFVIAYIYYIGRSLSGPTPKDVLEVPVFNTICLFSSSATIWLPERALPRTAPGPIGKDHPYTTTILTALRYGRRVAR